MNDRYLFKAKRIDNCGWVKGNLITDEQNEENAFIGYVFGTDDDGTPHDYDVVDVDPSTICQCTGLKDKNGNLIWENDIMLKSYHWDEEDSFDCYMQVVFKDNGFYLKDGIPDHFDELNSYMRNECSVEGNIFDNPELLEGVEE